LFLDSAKDKQKTKHTGGYLQHHAWSKDSFNPRYFYNEILYPVIRHIFTSEHF